MSSLPNHRIKEIIQILDQDRELPTLSPIVQKVLRLISDENVSINELATVIKNDVSLSFKILKVVNSAFYGFTRKVSTLSQAMVILGLSAVKNLALSMSILEVMMKGSKVTKGAQDFKVFWERSLFAAVAARRMSILAKFPYEEEIFIAALLQNVGMLVFIKHYPGEYTKLIEEARRTTTPIINLEDQQFGINHTMLGEFLANKWRLPRALTVPILRHHEPEGTPMGVEDEDKEDIEKRIQLIHLSHLATTIFYDEFRPDRVTQLKEGSEKYFGFGNQVIEDLLVNLSEEVKEVAEFFGLSLESAASYSELLAAANIELGKLNLSYEQMNIELVTARKRAEDLATQLSEANRKLEDMANLDGLTQIFNRRVFQNLITREFYRSNRYGHPLSCIMIDLDHFKQINDNEGHLVGDHVLRDVASLMQGILRKSDFLARYGGEEFVLLSPETDLKGATVLAEKLRIIIEKHPFKFESKSLSVTVSIGVSTMTKESDYKKEDDLIKNADKNLYAAKNNGRNRIWTDTDNRTKAKASHLTAPEKENIPILT
ncbi:hypothetical protein CEE37_03840 [candidate division LCP-89 bacterium B3_LCP]|uniref:diguanylate cyclase n=1 Tax=candidate division LCP-89 bacterium B3_LCP TaxID=2012998 RepID=A0A532V3I9_UNCL8|nr:MAG: hypothetical protein CEE37_03840 [candidate division LCP-89 bacterium B3_LCP]